MNKFIFCFSVFLSLCISSVFSQEIEEPDYDQIRQDIFNTRGSNYYPMLMRRFVACDTTLTLEQYRNLYFGYTLQEDFVPYKQTNTQLLEACRKFSEANGDASISYDIINDALDVLDDNPFNLTAINIVAVSYLQMGDTLQFKMWDIKQNGIIDAILSTGDGAEPSSAFHVIDIQHEYELLHRRGLEVEKDSVIDSHIEYLKLKENADNEKGFYFNFGACSDIYKMKYE